MTTATIDHVPYSGSTKAFLAGMKLREVRVAVSEHQAKAAYLQARLQGWAIARARGHDGTFSVRRVK